MSALHGYPRPQLERAEWFDLDGEWEFALDPEAVWKAARPSPIGTRAFSVPFSPETPASGIGNYGVFPRLLVSPCSSMRPQLNPGDRLILHFCAVDYCATVWVNGSPAAEHEGGYTPFCADITGFLNAGRSADDRGARRGRSRRSLQAARQAGLAAPSALASGIRAPPASGRPSGWSACRATYIGHVRWTPNVERWEIGFEAWLDGERRDDLRLNVKLYGGDTLLADDTYAVVAGEVHRRIALSDPGIDDYRNELLWSPATPTLIHAELKLSGGDGELLDTARSYTALRSIGVQGDKFVLNGRPYQLRMVLDQGYWPDTGITAPDDDALPPRRRTCRRPWASTASASTRRSRARATSIGPTRSACWSGRRCRAPTASPRTSIERLTREWTDVIARDVSHPCIIAWVPFNESWGVPDLPDSPAQRHYVQALYHLTKTLDPTRPVIGNDGWESVATDIIGIHDYDDQPERIAKRYVRRRDPAPVQARAPRRPPAAAAGRSRRTSRSC